MKTVRKGVITILVIHGVMGMLSVLAVIFGQQWAMNIFAFLSGVLFLLVIFAHEVDEVRGLLVKEGLPVSPVLFWVPFCVPVFIMIGGGHWGWVLGIVYSFDFVILYSSYFPEKEEVADLDD